MPDSAGWNIGDRANIDGVLGVIVECSNCAGRGQIPLITDLSRVTPCDECAAAGKLLLPDAVPLAARGWSDSPSPGYPPTVGRIAHYVDGVECYAAVVTRSDADVRLAGLAVLYPWGLTFAGPVRFDPGNLDGTWHWPETA